MNLEQLRERLGNPALSATIVPSPPRQDNLDVAVRGAVLTGPRGQYYCVDSLLEPDTFHGRYVFRDLIARPCLCLPAITGDLQMAEVNPGGVAFIDTETTGLGYGVGTQVFMVGVGHVTGDGFKVRQFFLRNPTEEPAVLAAIGEYLSPFQTLVSYNGRSFDWPLLENRFIYQRMWSQPLQPVHLDLLYTSRRLWKRRLESCSLSSVEQSVLRVQRSQADVEGWMIPQLYFRYVRTGDARPLARVFYHNLQDICSLALLANHIHLLMDDPWSIADCHAIDFLSLARMFELLGRVDVAERCITHALEQGLPGRLQTEAWLRLALINKRAGCWERAVPLFDQVLEHDGFERIACVELAKYHEHVARDASAAMRYTMRAIRAAGYRDVVSWPGTQRIELHHRHLRLRRKLAGQPQQAIA